MSGPRLKAFLYDIQRGSATRTGAVRFALQWVGHPATVTRKADLEAAERLGLLAWNGGTADLTDVARALLTVAL